MINELGMSPVVYVLATAALLAVSKYWAVERRCYFFLFTGWSNIHSLQLPLPDWECRCPALFSVQALCVLLMSSAAIALCSLRWAGVLSPSRTSSAVNPQLMSMFQLSSSSFCVPHSRLLQRQLVKRSQQGWFGEVKVWSCESGSILNRSCRRGSENRLVIKRLLVLTCLGWFFLLPSALVCVQELTCACLPSGPSQYLLGRGWKAVAKSVLPNTCLYQEKHLKQLLIQWAWGRLQILNSNIACSCRFPGGHH